MKFRVGDKVIIRDSELPNLSGQLVNITKIYTDRQLYLYKCVFSDNTWLDFRGDQLILVCDPNDLMKEIL